MSQDKQTAFNSAYWLGQPTAVRALPGISDIGERGLAAASLASQGYIIDVPIMVWAWDPYLVMKLREDYGYTWVPSALQPVVQMAPGLATPGLLPYDAKNPPMGAIIVTTIPLPPFDPPIPQNGQQNDGIPVGVHSVGNLYLSTPGDNYPDGAKYTDAQGTFLKHVVVIKNAVITPFGRTNYCAYYWEKIG
jgi:hypothetical protein